MKLVFYISFIVTVLCLVSCNEKHNGISDFLKNSDSASLAFYVTPDSSTQIVINDKTSIEKLGGYIDGRVSEPAKCTEDGSIWFYEGGKKKMEVDFSMNSDCSHFSYMLNDKLYNKEMSKDATKYLNSIKDIASE